jgi:hypothetical protein
MRVSAQDVAAQAVLDELLSDTTPNPPDALRTRVLEAARLLHRTYTANEWLDVVARIRARFDVAAVETIVVGVDGAFTTETDFEALVGDGWFRGYLDYTRESEAPAQFHFGAALTCISGALQRRPLIGWQGSTRLWPNIYTLLVGPTGTRKSTAIARALELVQTAFGTMLNVLPSEGSPQGYAGELRRRNLEGSPIADGLGVASELTAMLGRDTYKDALGKWLTAWYDNDFGPTEIWSRALKGEGRYELTRPYVCFIGASNMTWLRELPESLVKAGYMPRHLTFSAAGKRHIKANPQFDEIECMALTTLLRERIVDLPDRMVLSGDAAMYMDRWYEGRIAMQEEAAQDDELFSAWLGRKLPHALKIACVWQLADGGPKDELQEKWMRQATRLVDWMDSGVVNVYRALGTTGEGMAADAVLRLVERRGGKLTLDLIARTLKNRYNKRSVLDAVQMLVFAGMLTQVADPVGGAIVTLVKGSGGDNGAIGE